MNDRHEATISMQSDIGHVALKSYNIQTEHGYTDICTMCSLILPVTQSPLAQNTNHRPGQEGSRRIVSCAGATQQEA
ncbi:uncharacterized protein BO80DRAFT_33157 [Aspergillus ibericus CBS 121593]|uniref:Uncharacterized protein n=1 Tax=Aspergillus ibericus CBS 121593 TaxID=1448316 RepID=A0A395H5G1_9EURO|nr:hypothetical protein BO80DRAFT_33157 [Aspergillus ibericus CBS 121593]RAL02365.1 hypothetical protein BO80DRAFT_33157 [Aspergillus ibericus CBS 121593]